MRMSQNDGLNRRSFLRNAGLTALVGAVAPGSSLAAAAGAALAPAADGTKFDFDTPYSRIGTDSTKWDGPINTGLTDKDHIVAGMGIADMDFRAAPSITQALQERMKHDVWGYMVMPKSFPEGIIAWNKRRYGVDIDPQYLDITTGVHPGLIAALRAFSPPGSKVLLITPTYNGFYGDLRNTGTIAEESVMKVVNGRWTIDFDDFERRISRETNTFILCNPQNPTGNCWSAEELTRLGEICLRKRVIVLADEIHCDWTTKGQKYTPFASLPNKAIVNNSLTFKAASKSFGLAAMKCAWYYSTNKDLFMATKANNRADLTTLGMIASKAAYSGGEDWLNQCVDYVNGNHDLATSYIKANIPMIKAYNKAEGTYLMWIDVSQVAEKIGAKEKAAAETKAGKTTSPEQIVERWFLKNAGVALNPGHTYGAGGANHMRMNIALSRKTVQAALTSMQNALKSSSLSTAAL
jgi:cystathionine beta-lyase